MPAFAAVVVALIQKLCTVWFLASTPAHFNADHTAVTTFSLDRVRRQIMGFAMLDGLPIRLDLGGLCS